jgi:hypothetical protein
MKNRLAARLERQIRLRGEPVQLIRVVGTSKQSYVRVTVRGVVKTLTTQQLIAGVSQTNYLILLSPDELRRKGWPGAQTATNPPGTVPPNDPVIPTTADKVNFRNAEKAIAQAAAVYDGNVPVRIELRVLG